MLGTCNNCAHLNWVVADDPLYYCGFKAKRIENIDCECKAWKSANKSMTNADRIRAMTDEELKEFLCEFGQECNQCCAQDYCHYGHNGMLEWLRKEYEQ